jgi:hypothetical protein
MSPESLLFIAATVVIICIFTLVLHHWDDK